MISGALLQTSLVLYAYALSSGVPESVSIGEALGLYERPAAAAEAWEQYARAEIYKPLAVLASEYELSEFMSFAVNFALAAELDETTCAVVSALGGEISPVFAARLFAKSRDEAISLRADWLASANVTELLFSVTEQLKLNRMVLQFLLGRSDVRTLPRHLDNLATRIATVFAWENLVLPERQKMLLRHICARVRFDSAIYEDWGFKRVMPYGRGVRALFSGPPGTGKTMAAQVIAGELGMELYRVDISTTVSKYIGETEKNLDAVFREAEKCHGILFFDEADAIFGKRGEQRDSHDRYANMQTGFLLQRVEDYEGIVLLATNYIANMDPAFMRRIHVRVDFPAPDEEMRLLIWRELLKPPLRVGANVELDFLSRHFQLTGSEIKNIVLTAAFLAASQNRGIGMEDIAKALEMEYAKTDKILPLRELESLRSI